MDPPSNAEAFVHRCGRTARIGNKGAAVLLLAPSEVNTCLSLVNTLNTRLSLVRNPTLTSSASIRK